MGRGAFTADATWKLPITGPIYFCDEPTVSVVRYFDFVYRISKRLDFETFFYQLFVVFGVK